MTYDIEALRARVKELEDALFIEHHPCQGCGAMLDKDCYRHPERDCWREFHGEGPRNLARAAGIKTEVE